MLANRTRRADRRIVNFVQLYGSADSEGQVGSERRIRCEAARCHRGQTHLVVLYNNMSYRGKCKKMNIYYVIFIIVILLSIIEYFKLLPLHDKYLIFLLSLAYSFFIGLRYGGVDYWEYYNALVINHFHFENGFGLISFFAKILTNCNAAVFLFTAFFSVIIRFNIYRKYCPYFGVALLVYMSTYFYLDFGQIRNALSASIMLASFAYLEKNNTLMCCVIIFIAAQVHSIAYAGFFLPLINWLYFKKKKHLFFLMASLGVIVFIVLFFERALGSYLAQFALIFHTPNVGYIYNKIAYYSNPDTSRSMGAGLGIIKMLGTLLIFTLFYKKANKMSCIYKISYVSYAIGVFSWFIFFDLSTFAYRFLNFFSTGEALLWSCVIKSFNANVRIIFFIMFILFYSLLFVKLFSGNEYISWLFINPDW